MAAADGVAITPGVHGGGRRRTERAAGMPTALTLLAGLVAGGSRASTCNPWRRLAPAAGTCRAPQQHEPERSRAMPHYAVGAGYAISACCGRAQGDVLTRVG
jgi:hypothetical protein